MRAPSRRGSGAIGSGARLLWGGLLWGGLLWGGLLGDPAVQLGPAVGVDVVGGACGLVEGVAEPTLGGYGDRPGGHGRLGERPSVGVDDDRAGHPVDAALPAGAVAGGDEHPIDRRVGLDPDDLGRPLAVGPRER